MAFTSTTISQSSKDTKNISVTSTSLWSRLGDWTGGVCGTVVHHARKHTGVGIVCSVAYFDPGNWGVDLQAGSVYGYRLLFVILLAGIFAAFLQVLASRLGCVTGLDLSSHCRLLLHSRKKNTLLIRWLVFYPLYAMSEAAIIATDLAELLGSAIALCLLFPKLELWHGVLITSADVLLLLAFGDPLRGRPLKLFEFLITGLVFAVLVCMAIIIAKIQVDWMKAFQGFLPSKYVVSSGAVYTSVGIIGATVMPHSLFLGSALATQDRISTFAKGSDAKSSPSAPDPLPSNVSHRSQPRFSLSTLKRLGRHAFYMAFRAPPESGYATRANQHEDRENNSYAFVKAHIYHGTVDMVTSLMGFAVLINSLILVLAGAVFFYGSGTKQAGAPASLFDAYDLIRDSIGQSAATLFAIALLAAGQSSSIIATLGGQAVSEGFLRWRISPVLRRIVTRLLAMIPSMAVAIAVGKPGIDQLLVISQVVLSIVLPFVMVPLIWCTSSSKIMAVRRPIASESESESPSLPPAPSVPGGAEDSECKVEEGHAEMVDFSSGWIVTALGGMICVLVIVANVYALITLGTDGG